MRVCGWERSVFNFIMKIMTFHGSIPIIKCVCGKGSFLWNCQYSQSRQLTVKQLEFQWHWFVRINAIPLLSAHCDLSLPFTAVVLLKNSHVDFKLFNNASSPCLTNRSTLVSFSTNSISLPYLDLSLLQNVFNVTNNWQHLSLLCFFSARGTRASGHASLD